VARVVHGNIVSKGGRKKKTKKKKKKKKKKGTSKRGEKGTRQGSFRLSKEKECKLRGVPEKRDERKYETKLKNQDGC